MVAIFCHFRRKNGVFFSKNNALINFLQKRAVAGAKKNRQFFASFLPKFNKNHNIGPRFPLDLYFPLFRNDYFIPCIPTFTKIPHSPTPRPSTGANPTNFEFTTTTPAF
jgi:hypothetical protein